MREPEVESLVREHLNRQGYSVTARGTRTGPDIIARKAGRSLLVEVKGDRPGHESSPGTINVDVMTLLGQVVYRKGRRAADEYAIAIRPVHQRLVREAMPALRELNVRALLVGDGGSIEELQ